MLSGLATMLIQPVTDALGMLGSGQFGDVDPTQLLGGIAPAFESAGRPVQQAMAGLDGTWQGQAANAAMAKTSAALVNGHEVASQASSLGASLSVATASVAQAEAQLLAIINQFLATLAAIGPSLPLPWGWAAAIAAANQAITGATQVTSQLTASLDAEAAHVTAAGAPVPVTSPPAMATNLGASAAATPALAGSTAVSPSLAAAGAPLGATSGLASLAPMMGLATSLASPAMEGVSAATGAIGSAAAQPASGQPAGAVDQHDRADDDKQHGPPHDKSGIGGGGGTGSLGGIAVGSLTQSRTIEPMTVPETEAVAPAVSGVTAEPGAAGTPMGGAPMGSSAKAGAGKIHNAAAFLHTSDQGDEIVGDVGAVATSVIGARAVNTTPEIELRI